MSLLWKQLAREMSAMSGDPMPAAIQAVPLTVETVDNHIYFYSDVDGDRCLALLKTIREVDSRLRMERVSRTGTPVATAPPGLG